jgi:DNA polymerase III sliding clamp (beta) subunit (PCNA family)
MFTLNLNMFKNVISACSHMVVDKKSSDELQSIHITTSEDYFFIEACNGDCIMKTRVLIEERLENKKFDILLNKDNIKPLLMLLSGKHKDSEILKIDIKDTEIIFYTQKTQTVFKINRSCYPKTQKLHDDYINREEKTSFGIKTHNLHSLIHAANALNAEFIKVIIKDGKIGIGIKDSHTLLWGVTASPNAVEKGWERAGI